MLIRRFRVFLPFQSCQSHKRIAPKSKTTVACSTSLFSVKYSNASGGMSRKYVGQEDAQKIDLELFNEYHFSLDQLMELAGLSVAEAVATCYSKEKLSRERPRVLIVCGPGNNGGDGLVAARHLMSYDYVPDIYYPKRSAKPIFENLVSQCEKMEVRFLKDLPTPDLISADYDVVLDAIFGFSFKGNVRAPFDDILKALKAIKVPICSIDVPSGWEVEGGDMHRIGLQPEMLISLTIPKLCAKFFKGPHHYLGLRIVPRSLLAKYDVSVPLYPGVTQCIKLNY